MRRPLKNFSENSKGPWPLVSGKPCRYSFLGGDASSWSGDERRVGQAVPTLCLVVPTVADYIGV
jgi:hypothetical protein